MSLTITVDVDSGGVMAGLEAMPVVLAAEVEKALVISTHLVEAEVKALTPRRTGRLFASWHSDVGWDKGTVSNRVGYAGYVERGTGPHIIEAHGRALVIPINRFGGFGGATLSGRLRAGQQFILRKRVLNPGFAGRHMAEIGTATAKPAVIQIFRDAIRDAARLAFGK